MRYQVIQDALRTEEGLDMQRTILSVYSLDLDYSDKVLSYLTEIQHVLSKDFKDEKMELTENKDAALQASPEGLDGDKVKESVNSRETLRLTQDMAHVQLSNNSKD